MDQIDMGLLLLVVVAIIAVIGLIIALQTTGGRRRLADAALRLAESLLAYAIRWLESIGPDVPDVPGVTLIEVESHDLARARAAQACLQAISVHEIQTLDGQA
jgi:hypothetical protein